MLKINTPNFCVNQKCKIKNKLFFDISPKTNLRKKSRSRFGAHQQIHPRCNFSANRICLSHKLSMNFCNFRKSIFTKSSTIDMVTKSLKSFTVLVKFTAPQTQPNFPNPSEQVKKKLIQKQMFF